MKPSVDARRKLIIAGTTAARRGRVSDAALEIVHAFYTDEQPVTSLPLSGDPVRNNVHGEYWQLMVCVLAERCARLEHIAEIERCRAFGTKPPELVG